MNKTRIILCLVVFAIGILLGCDSNKEDATIKNQSITKTSSLLYLNNHRTQLVMDDGYTVNILGDTFVSLQRESCSGFEEESIIGMSLGINSSTILFFLL